METVNKILDWLKSQPSWIRAVAILVIAAVASILFFSSCGSMNKVTVRSLDPSTTVTISVSQSTTNDTDNTIDPNVNLNIKPNETQK